ncbi:MAG: tetraacyldisaccharide 4'-kinase [Alphaproteobacteria bacterium]|nr:tetraacyldisaccharide 4'-kinase [Alphaproteobacteria bacterium]
MRAPAFWSGPSALSALLMPLGAVYAAAGKLRRMAVSPQKPPVPVICVGNLVAGGAGKTPVAQAIARRMIAQGVEVHFLSRGYGGKLKGPVRVVPGIHNAADVGDEPLLLAETATCWVAADRVAGAQAAAAGGAQVIVMDDGHQNPSLAKSASIVVVDGETGFGNGRVIPAGPLREPVAEGLARADAVVVLGEDKAGVAGAVPQGMPLLHGHLAPTEESHALDGESVLAFAGIGRPEKFFDTVRALGCKLVEQRGFPDHHPYSYGQAREIIDAAWAKGALPVTTAKDAVRLPPDLRAPVMVVEVEVVWREPALLDEILLKALRHG